MDVNVTRELRVGLPGEEGGRFPQDLPFLAQDPVLPAQAAELLALFRRQTVRTQTGIQVDG